MENINILSLFDGISCGQIALNRAGIKYKNYFASEIERDSINVTQHNYPDTIQLGDVTKLDTEKLPEIYILMGGSPCQDLSRANKNGEGLRGDRSGLFWNYVDIMNAVKPKYFLLENVVMKKEWSDIITEELGVEPIEINSNLVSAQNRRRLYWTNIPGVTQPEDRGILIKDIIYDDGYKNFTDERITKTKKITKNYVKWDMSGKQYWSQQDRAYFKQGKMCTLPKNNPSNKLNILLDYDRDIYRRIHPIEAERCQNVPDNYTGVEGIRDSKRLEMLGNGWTVDVIAHIFSHIPKIGEINNN
jgi:site-specific DNA-cytosine methylase